ncbi:SLG1 [Fusarium albosuccineum]|uniref:SLG1 n=1 Tax=Fusarium albosuccineum TaxID=1237068 RepID=A0A8H4LCC1_9HYPO|nr:SLG1 [Fusarium albosuccineum]
MTGSTFIYAAFVFCATLATAARDPTQQPATEPVLNQFTSQGCFSSLSSSASKNTKVKGSFLSEGACGNACKDLDKPVAIAQQQTCYCADTYPPKSALVSDDECNSPCPGYAPDACGGPEAYSVWNTGLEVAVDSDEKGDATTETKTGASTTTVADSTKTAATAATETESADATSTASDATTTASVASAQGSTDAASTAEPAATPSQSTVENNAAQRLSSPVGKLVKMVQVVVNSCVGRS